ncbi:translocation/assembly module TamB domain-containing protein [Fodinicurvata sp. EGI_FJ10296]|uniref:translocation/assembly module TamB domain-containing protein n=1 Tax=Fodinicurvata sp. EGI_FJ10296 TaxID=3231908 RepID=UPI0034555043
MKTAIRVLLAIPLLLVAFIGGFYLYANTDHGRGVLVDLINGFAGDGVEIGAIEGHVPFDMTLRDLRVADAQGPWLEVDEARLAWTPRDLIGRTLRVTALEAGTVAVARLPAPGPEAEDEPSGGAGFPDLPVDVVVERLVVDRLALGEPVAGQAADLRIEASARLGDPARGLAIAADIHRLDGVATDLVADIVFVPETERLSVDVGLTEAPGGVLGGLLELAPGQGLTLRADGEGTLSAFDGELVVDGGEALGSDIQVSLDRSSGSDGEGIRLTADGWVVPHALLPERFVPLSGDRMTVSADATIGEQSVQIDGLSVDAAAGRVSVDGRVARDASDLALNYSLEAGDADLFAGLLSDALAGEAVAWDRLALSGTIVGRVMNPAVDLTADIAGGRFGGRGAEDLTLSAALRPDRPVTDPDMRAGFEIDARARGVATGIPALDEWLAVGVADAAEDGGPPVSLSAAGVAGADGDVVLEQFALSAPTGRLATSGTVADFGDTFDATAELVLDDLSTLAAFTGGLTLEGGLDLEAEISRADGRTAIDLQGALEGFDSGIAQIDGLFGPDIALAGRAEIGDSGQLALPSLSVTGEGAGLNASGSLVDGGVDGEVEGGVTLTIDDLAALDPMLSGAAQINARASGPLSAPSLGLGITSDRMVAADRVVENLVASVAEIDLETMTGRLTAAATLDDRPVSIATTAGYDPSAQQVSIADLEAGLGSAAVSGDVDVDLTTLTGLGSLSLSVPDLSELSDLTGMAMAGEVTADIGLDQAADPDSVSETESGQAAGRQDLSIDARGLGVVVDGNRVGQATLSGTVSDVLGAPTADLSLTMRDVDAAGQALSSLDIDVSGEPGAFDIDFDAAGPDVTLSAGGRVTLPTETDAALDIALESLQGSYSGEPVTLASPTSVTIEDGDISIGQTNLGIRDGQISLGGTVGETIAIDGSLTNIPLQIADQFAGDQGVSGRLSGSFSASGSLDAPTAQLELSAVDVQSAAARNLGLAAANVDLTADWDGQAVRIDADATLPGGSLTANVSLPMALSGPSAGAEMSGTVSGAVDLSLLNPLLAAGGDRVSGGVAVDIDLGGSFGDPDIQGSIRLDGGSYENPLTGVELTDIGLTATATGDSVRVDQLVASTPGGGRISGSGSVGLDAEAGMPVDIQLTADRARPIDTPYATPTLNADLTLGGQLMAQSQLSGTVTLLETVVTVPDRLPSSVRTIEVRERNAPEGRGGSTQSSTAGAGDGRPPDDPSDAEAPLLQRIGLDIRVVAPGAIFVRGRGLNAELGGEISVVGTAANPIAQGAFTMRQGRLNLLGNMFDFDQGRVTLDGDAIGNPLLDFEAIAPVGDGVTATISVTGRASDPQIRFFSDPPLPQDEVLARILFGRATADLSAFQALQLAQSIGQLAGIGDESNLIDDVRRAVGLDRLDLDFDDAAAGGGVSITAGQYLTENVFVGVRQGASGSSRVNVEIDVTDNIKIEGDVGTDRSRVGVRFEWEY